MVFQSLLTRGNESFFPFLFSPSSSRPSLPQQPLLAPLPAAPPQSAAPPVPYCPRQQQRERGSTEGTRAVERGKSIIVVVRRRPFFSTPSPPSLSFLYPKWRSAAGYSARGGDPGALTGPSELDREGRGERRGSTRGIFLSLLFICSRLAIDGRRRFSPLDLLSTSTAVAASLSKPHLFFFQPKKTITAATSTPPTPTPTTRPLRTTEASPRSSRPQRAGAASSSSPGLGSRPRRACRRFRPPEGSMSAPPRRPSSPTASRSSAGRSSRGGDRTRWRSWRTCMPRPPRRGRREVREKKGFDFFFFRRRRETKRAHSSSPPLKKKNSKLKQATRPSPVSPARGPSRGTSRSTSTACPRRPG